jgi:TRAP-type C4-dicarboxylate transport system permease small subunit
MQIQSGEETKGSTLSASRLLGRFVNHFEEWAAIAALAGMTVLYALSVLSRYITKTSLPWTDELVRYLFIWATFLGASIGVRRGAHLGVAVVQNLLPPRGQKIFAILIALCCVFTCAVLVRHGAAMVNLQFTMAQRSSQLGIPIYWVGLAIPVGLLLCLIRFIQVLFQKLRA